MLKKLDHIMGNLEFMDLFPGSYALFQPYRILDHSSAILKIPSLVSHKPKPFKFFKFLTFKSSFMEVVGRVWSMQVDGHNMFKVVSKLKALKRPLRKLLHDQGNLHERVNKLRKELAFNEVKLDEKWFLKQKAKVDWLEACDANSAYFHKTVKCKNQYSRIEEFLDTLRVCKELDVADLFPNQISESCASNMDFFINGQILKEVNHTFLALIPKGIMEVVSENQSAFVSGKRILDNILITQELMHNYHRNRGPPRYAFKVDIQKAYDTVDWSFLGNIFNSFGFHPTMVKWIMACVTLASFLLSINGNIHGYFKEECGLRQGDPLSPYLFTLVMEVLTLSFKHDIFIFAHGDVESAWVIKESLDEFKEVSGLVPSLPKSTVFFCNVMNHVKMAILNIMPFSEDELPVKYLGVPLISSRLLNKDCKILVEKAKTRISDWKNKSLSFAGRLQLCKSVISSMHIYWASVLVIPKDIIYDIHQLIRGFLWCNGEYRRGKAKVVWEAICLPKREGGLGLRSLDVFNIALMTTHIWNIVSNKESLWPWLVKAPVLGMVQLPQLQPMVRDKIQWFDFNRNMVEFSVARAWEALRPRDHEVKRSPEDIRDCIMVTIRLKLLSFRFKNKQRALVHLWHVTNVDRLVVQASLEVNM
ncbi:protein LAZ1, partial [Tanacetum coccineum]